MNLDLVTIIREAVINYPERKFLIYYLSRALGVSKNKAKELIFSWAYRAENETLIRIANEPEREVHRNIS